NSARRRGRDVERVGTGLARPSTETNLDCHVALWAVGPWLESAEAPTWFAGVTNMTRIHVNPQRFDPYKNFKFRVIFDSRPVAGFTSISHHDAKTGVVDHRAGGDPSVSPKLHGWIKYEPITLERGVTHDAGFEQWANAVVRSGRVAGGSLKDLRKDVV